MRLTDWFKKQPRGAKEKLARECHISRPSVYAGEAGALTDMRVILAIVNATRGRVTVGDLTHRVKARGFSGDGGKP
jgi:hypothetical protein